MRQRHRRAGGFTLVELLIVMVIIGILLAFILVVSMDGARRADERATQALIEKLDGALNDRISALLSIRVNPTQAHGNMATIVNGTNVITGPQRAQIIAQYDYLRAELPDVFYVPTGTDANLSANYPINFAAPVFPNGVATPTDLNYAVPIDFVGNYTAVTNGTPITGMYGASFTAAGGLYKLLGYQPTGYNGVDDNADASIPPLVDEFAESGMTAAQLTARLAKHQHKTARSEMLYALLVEGQGPLGSAFNADDFTSREVQDTDGDGLPEFVDAWGEPLRFYRWPIYCNYLMPGSGQPFDTTQKGPLPYTTFETRDQDPLDPNQTLVAPAWWGNTFNNGDWTSGGFANGTPVTPPGFFLAASAPAVSAEAVAFMTFFHSLFDPTAGTTWDRGNTQRRAYRSKYLIVSAGPDKVLGNFELDLTSANWTALTAAQKVGYMIAEGSATPHGLRLITPTLFPTTLPIDYTVDPGAGEDDISNRNLSAPGGAIQ